jgi:AraC family transcriptional activator of pobA
MADNPSIPVHTLTDRTNLGLEIHRIDEITSAEIRTFGVHRDDHCILLFQQTGSSAMMVDFREVSFVGCVAFCVLPGQVHHSITWTNISGWFLAIDLASIDEPYRVVFEEYRLHAVPVPVEFQTAQMLDKSVVLLLETIDFQKELPFQSQVLHSLIQVCVGTFATIFQQHKQENVQVNSRPVSICAIFKSLVIKNYKSVKSPAAYAAMLYITASYLNEAVKGVTGFSVTYWIQQEVILEAKRLLCYTDLTVKEIAFQLGYEDSAYFSRLFHKVTESTPLTFRRQYRK